MTTTRNRTTKSIGLGRTPITPSASICANMVRIDWTDAKSVTVTARKDFQLTVLAINTKTGETVKAVQRTAKTGQTFYFVASSHAGLYYIGSMSEQLSAQCSCLHFKNKRFCKHQSSIVAAHESKERNGEFALMYREAVKELLADREAEVEAEVTVAEEDVTDVTVDLQTATWQERVNYWKAARKRQKAADKAFNAEYWGKVHELRAQAS